MDDRGDGGRRRRGSRTFNKRGNCKFWSFNTVDSGMASKQPRPKVVYVLSKDMLVNCRRLYQPIHGVSRVISV
jgi:hypothetical protein